MNLDTLSPGRQTGKVAETGIRQLQESDLLEAGRLTFRSANPFRKDAGLPLLTTRLRRPLPLMQHIYHQAPELSWGAYHGDKLIGCLVSHIRDRQWYAGYLFVDPAHQQLGIGRDLMQAGLAEAREREIYFLSQCTFTYNLRAVGLYSSLGLFPRKNLFLMKRPNKGEWSLPPHPETLAMAQISSSETVSELNRMDCEVRGINRAADHCYWLADDDYTGYVFTVADRVAGYAYISRDGSIGPVLAARDVYLSDIIVYCLRELRQKKNEEIRVWVSGKNFAVLQILLENHFHFHEIAILMTNRVFCDLRRYLPHSLVIF